MTVVTMFTLCNEDAEKHTVCLDKQTTMFFKCVDERTEINNCNS